MAKKTESVDKIISEIKERNKDVVDLYKQKITDYLLGKEFLTHEDLKKILELL
jgi:ATP-dependent Zn protease